MGVGGSQSKRRYIHVSSYFAQRKKWKQPHRIRNFCTLQIKIIETTVGVIWWRIEFVCGARKLYRVIAQRFLFSSSPLWLSRSPFFFLRWLYHFKGRFIRVWREIHRSKILPVTSWQLTNRTVSDISRRADIAYVNHFFPREIYNTSRPRDFVARSVAAGPHALKLASFTFKNLWEVNL